MNITIKKLVKNSLKTMCLILFTQATYADGSDNDIKLLTANFNDKVPGTFIGTGGAEANEPITNALIAEVVEDSPGENHLLVTNDGSSTNARSMRWEMLDNQEITNGMVTFSLQFTPSALDDYSISIREFNSSASSYLTINFTDAGTIAANDALGNIDLNFNTYSAGVLDIELIFDMDSRTSTIIINNDTLFVDRAHGITDSSMGVGALLIGHSAFSAFSSFKLDNLLISMPAPPLLVLDADFNDKVLNQGIGTGGAVVGEPVEINENIMHEVIEARGLFNHALSLQNLRTGPLHVMNWELISGVELNAGVVTIEADLIFNTEDSYGVAVFEQGDTTAEFINIGFNANGDIILRDNNGTIGNVGNYLVDEEHHLSLIFDFDTGTYSAYFDEGVLIENRAHGVDSTIGLGSLLLGFSASSTANASFEMDNLKVQTTDYSVDVIYCDGFE